MQDETTLWDAIIVGGGAAGLQAAAILDSRRIRTTLLEARDRIGGRILTLHEVDWPIALDVGAELIHGDAPETMALLDADWIEQLPDTHFLHEPRGRFRLVPDFYRAVAEAERYVPPAGEHHVEEVISAVATDNPQTASLLRMFVEGFHAADPGMMSATELAHENDGTKQFRSRSGYGEIVETLERRLQSGVSVQRSTVVERIIWEEGDVRVTVRQENARSEIRGRRLVMTAPISILQNGAIAFDPPIPSLNKACLHLHMGHIVKIILGFRTSFWEDPEFASRHFPAVDHRPLNFLHEPDAPFQTWWTMSPSRVPILVAWSGGRAALGIERLSPEMRLGEALQTLGTLLEIDPAYLEGELVNWKHHDWFDDPWSRGAYSYAGIGGDHARANLAVPVDGTIFFAGEAMSEKHPGTVEGALETGRRAAEQVMASLGR